MTSPLVPSSVTLEAAEATARALAKLDTGPNLILAGPGSGKTFLLALRAKHLIDLHVDMNTVMVLTFGRDANAHLADLLVDPGAPFQLTPSQIPTTIQTMHALGLKVVKDGAHHFGLAASDINVLDDDDVKQLLFTDAALGLGLPLALAEQTAECRTKGACSRDETSETCRTCGRYRAILAKCGYIDFDDQILLAVEVLLKDPQLLDRYQAAARHVLVDEYQDINAAQFRLIELLTLKSQPNLFVVGDDAQSIYGFRGGDPEFIKDFTLHFAGSARHELPTSRRCSRAILEASHRVLKQFYRNWNPPASLAYKNPEGTPPRAYLVPTPEVEAEAILKLARSCTNLRENLLVLSPSADLFIPISRLLTRNRIAHQSQTGLISRDTRRRLHRVRSLIRWLADPTDNYLLRLAIDVVSCGGTACVPGKKRDKKTRPPTELRRAAFEVSVAGLWDGVLRPDSTTTLWEELASHKDGCEDLTRVFEYLSKLKSLSEDKSKNAGGELVWCNRNNLTCD